jgi:CRP-like cAMP-binding protein
MIESREEAIRLNEEERQARLSRVSKRMLEVGGPRVYALPRHDLVEEALRVSGEPLSRADLCTMLGLHHIHLSRIIKELVDSGRVEYAGRRQEARIDGSHYPVPVYRPKEGA